jgi:uncharacterized protein YbbC (DUF1343 family)/CubicO group peptidase (beta-lactamase class C family)
MRSILLLSIAACLAAQEIPQLDAVIEAAIAKGELPGAVCLVGYKDRILHKKAYGQRSLEPTREAMTLDTIFDAASLTKVVATTSSILRLIEDGKVRLADRVTVYLPEFQGGKSEITIRHLLTHYSGLRPDLDLVPEWSGYELGIQKALVDKPVGEPGVKFVYSDINFILLGEIVRKVSGKPLNEFAREQVFTPLGMSESGFLPDPSLKGRIAPTEGKLRGIVHDETTRFMGGVAGHAGLFTTADDLAKFARMILRKGSPLFAPLTIAAATRMNAPGRGLGWDIDSPFAGNRGDLYPVGSFGHTGFTGTSLWIDPSTESYVILLANAVHPYRRPPITPLRGRVASVAAAYVSRMFQAASSGEPVMTGLDRLIEEKFTALANKKVGLITNHTGLARDGRRNIDAMISGGVALKALFSPEHGIFGKEDQEKVDDTRDPVSKLPVYSLYYGEKREPNPATLKGIDALVFDIQDIGTRFYTYGCSMKNAMDVAAKLNIQFIVLDRPNPITGEHVEGPVMDPAEMSFVGCLPMPLRHGFTMGELARYANDQLPKKAKLTVVPMKNWKRSYWFDQTGLSWVNPSPNMKSLAAATLYPGVGMIEYAKNYSVGRGTDAPFEQVGAPWIDGQKLANTLNAMEIPGVRAHPTSFEPTASIHAGKKVEGVRFILTERNRFDSTLLGLSLIEALSRLYPKQIDLLGNRKLIGSLETIRRLDSGEAATKIRDSWMKALDLFSEKRQQYLIYP